MTQSQTNVFSLKTPTAHSVVSQDTYDMVTNVLAGKIMTALLFTRPSVAQQNAIELFGLFDKGVSAKGIDMTSLALQVFDVYFKENDEMSLLASRYFKQIAQHGLDFSDLDMRALREALSDQMVSGSLNDFAAYLCAKAVC